MSFDKYQDKYPHKPSRKSSPKSSSSGGGKRKTWLSECNVFINNRDVSARLQFPWWKSPLMKSERLIRAASRKLI